MRGVAGKVREHGVRDENAQVIQASVVERFKHPAQGMAVGHLLVLAFSADPWPIERRDQQDFVLVDDHARQADGSVAEEHVGLCGKHHAVLKVMRARRPVTVDTAAGLF